MLNLLQLLIALLILFANPAGERYRGIPWQTLGACAGAILAIVIVGQVLVGFVRSAKRRQALTLTHFEERTAEGNDDEMGARLAEVLRGALAVRVSRLHLLLDALCLAGYFALFAAVDLAGFVTHVLRIPRGLDTLPLLFPYLLLLAASWTATSRMAALVKEQPAAMFSYMLFHARTTLFGLLPVIVIQFGLWALHASYSDMDLVLQSFHFAESFAPLPLVLALFFVLPFGVRMILPARRLKHGPLLERLQDVSRRCGVRINGIFIWHTGRAALPTAFYVGLAPPFRYVFLSDALLKILNDDEIDAVFAHELGHARHRHLWLLLAYMFGFSIISMALLVFLTTLAGGASLNVLAEGVSSDGVVSFSFSVFLLLYLVIGFGYLSRRLERQADFFAARKVGPRSIQSALDRLAWAAGGIHFRPGWRHFSIERRLRELAVMATPEESEREEVQSWERERKIFLGVFFTLLLLSAAALAPLVEDDVSTGLSSFPMFKADRLRAAAASEEASENAEEREHSARLYALALTRMERYLARPDIDAERRLPMLIQAGITELLATGGREGMERAKAFIRETETLDLTRRDSLLTDLARWEEHALAAHREGKAFFAPRMGNHFP